MKVIKCIGCGQLKRELLEIRLVNKPVVYYCPRALDRMQPLLPRQVERRTHDCSRFPYYAALSGLLRPGKGIREAAAGCPEDIKKCVICGSTEELVKYGPEPVAFACKAHNQSWSDWLDQHPNKLESFKPKGRVVTRLWIDVFREWVEDAKLKMEVNKLPT